MSEDYLVQQQPTLTWNTARGVWEKAGMANLLCEHWELFSETWQTSGWMRNGQVFELPMQEHRTTALEFSSLPTPQTMDTLPARDGEARERQLRRGGSNSRRTSSGNLREDILQVLPTPTTQDGKNNAGPSQFKRNSNPLNVEAVLLPTTTTYDWKGANNSGSGTTSSVGLATKIDNLETNWGKFEPAIRRWEEILGRPAPLPTKPDGKDGAHRLSSAFTEWMMGLPAGWITDVGLSRNEELKACGNGVVPQQAELALRVLLDGISFESKRGGGKTVLPTPTVMDQRDGKHFRAVAIKNLAEGANRGLNLNNIVEAGLTNWQDGEQFEIVDGKAVKKPVSGE